MGKRGRGRERTRSCTGKTSRTQVVNEPIPSTDERFRARAAIRKPSVSAAAPASAFVPPRTAGRRMRQPTKGVTMGIRFLKIAAIYLAIGVSMGLAMGIMQNFALHPVHAHINLL